MHVSEGCSQAVVNSPRASCVLLVQEGTRRLCSQLFCGVSRIRKVSVATLLRMFLRDFAYAMCPSCFCYEFFCSVGAYAVLRAFCRSKIPCSFRSTTTGPNLGCCAKFGCALLLHSEASVCGCGHQCGHQTQPKRPFVLFFKLQ